MVSLAGHQPPRARFGATGEYTFFLKMLVFLSKPYLQRKGASWAWVNMSSNLGLMRVVPQLQIKKSTTSSRVV